MCTLTIVPLEATPGGRSGGLRVPAAPAAYRLAVNRDESRRRPPARPPEVRRVGARLAAMPIDTLGGGTWVGVNDAGLSLALLNAYDDGAAADAAGPGPPRPAPPPPESRGLIIPSLLGAGTLAEAAAGAGRIRTERFAPFKLFITDGREILVFGSDGSRLAEGHRRPAGAPWMLTSSGLGDRLVAGPRGKLFDEMFLAGGSWTELQDRFHRHSWPDRPGLSVCMRRADARTVSLTVLEAAPEGARLVYYPDSPDTDPEPAVVRLAPASRRAA